MSKVETPPMLLAKSIESLESGAYDTALAITQQLLTDPAINQRNEGHWLARALVVAARSSFFMEHDDIAKVYLGSIDSEYLSTSPELLAEYLALLGLLGKRQAYRAFKERNVKRAKQDVGDAIMYFERAAPLCVADAQQLLKHNACLNIAYCKGLRAAIDGRSAKDNPGLLADAISSECAIREWSSPRQTDRVTGIVIIADLARGANLSVEETRRIANVPKGFAGDCLRLFGPGGQTSWPDLLSTEATKAISTRPTSAAKALILGGTLLLQPRYRPKLETLSNAYVIDMVDVLARLKVHNPRGNLLMRSVFDVKQRLVEASGCHPWKIKDFR